MHLFSSPAAPRGIGRAIRERLEDKGHRLINLDRQPVPGKQTDEIACDLNDPVDISKAIDQAPAQLSAVICVAGVGPIPSPPDQQDRINYLGTRLLIERLLPRIESGGAVTLIASSAGRDWKDNRTHVDSMLDTPSFESGLEWLEHHPTRWQNDPYKFSKQCLAAYTYRAAGLGSFVTSGRIASILVSLRPPFLMISERCWVMKPMTESCN